MLLLYLDAVIRVLINNESLDLTMLDLKSSVSLSFLTSDQTACSLSNCNCFIGLYTLKDFFFFFFFLLFQHHLYRTK